MRTQTKFGITIKRSPVAKMTKEQFAERAHEFCQNIGQDMVRLCLEVWEKLTEEERESLGRHELPLMLEATPYYRANRLSRTILMTQGADRLDQQWSADGLKPGARRLTRILRRRC